MHKREGAGDVRQGRFFVQGHEIAAKPVPPGLHLVATPIGNLGDITIRALETLAGADLILAEDTRVSRKLMSFYGIATPCRSFHEHSGPDAVEAIAARLKEGASIALISDAGTPLLSDPGAALVAHIRELGLPVSPIPGASALLAALVASGMADGPFHFAGFLPSKPVERRQMLQGLASAQSLLVFYEAPHRLIRMLEDAQAILGDRQAMVARELTKRYETFRSGRLSELLHHYSGTEEPRGEIVVLIAPGTDGAEEGIGLDQRLIEAMAGHSIKDAAQIVSAAMGLPKRQVYARALELQAALKGRAE
jgi:16S rRNA (cytidine1402-2'-O)-methyltransferase